MNLRSQNFVYVLLWVLFAVSILALGWEIYRRNSPPLFPPEIVLMGDLEKISEKKEAKLTNQSLRITIVLKPYYEEILKGFPPRLAFFCSLMEGTNVIETIPVSGNFDHTAQLLILEFATPKLPLAEMVFVMMLPKEMSL